MDADNPVVKLCVAGMQAEAAGKLEQAAALFQQAWQACTNDYEACIAAHYLARHQSTPADTLRWNQEALDRARLCDDEQVQDFLPSLYLNIGYSYELLSIREQALRFYELAAEAADSLGDGRYAETVRDGTARGIQRAKAMKA
ncbi:MAG: hypothetical protein ACWGO1_06830 [Anaerolineales bacterium]